jgi:arylsulfatase A
MNRRELLKAGVAGAALAAWPRVLRSAGDLPPVKRPNIVLILADDLGYECLGANGSTTYKTPVLDGLAAKGMRFDRCYAQPLCTPTRVQLMTGIYNVRNYIQFGLMDPKATTFAHLLKKAGYATCMSGKWQLGKDPELPKKFGFDEACLWQHTRRASRYANPGFEVDGKPVDYANGEYGPDIEAKFALDFITRHAKQPFFLYWPMVLTHGPFEPTPDSPDWGDKGGAKAPAGSGRTGQQHFEDMVAYMDKMVGNLTAHLDKLALRENTLILFLGDNGTGKGIVSSTGDKAVKGAKGEPNLSGMHVPMVASWPGVCATGQVCPDPIDTTDFLPTLCAATGAAVPEELKIDGRSFLPQLRGQKANPRQWLYCWYARDGGPKAAAEFAYNRRYVLHRGGELERIADDGQTTTPPDAKDDAADAGAARKTLQAALDHYADARASFLKRGGQRGQEP